MITILFPSDFFDQNKPDDSFKNEYLAAVNVK